MLWKQDIDCSNYFRFLYKFFDLKALFTNELLAYSKVLEIILTDNNLCDLNVDEISIFLSLLTRNESFRSLCRSAQVYYNYQNLYQYYIHCQLPLLQVERSFSKLKVIKELFKNYAVAKWIKRTCIDSYRTRDK